MNVNNLEYDLERSAVRVVLVDAADSVLLLHVRDSQRPGVRPWWELPGGGRQDEETPTQVAVRELAEETGLVVHPDQVSAPTWFRSCTYLQRDLRVLQHEVIVVARIDSVKPDLGKHHRSPMESVDIIGSLW